MTATAPAPIVDLESFVPDGLRKLDDPQKICPELQKTLS
jgi:hypothetical protein